MDGIGEHHLKWNYAGSGGQKPHVLFHIEYRPNTNATMLWNTGHNNGKDRVKERNSEIEYGLYTLYTGLTIEILNLLKSP
jgi:hypothetical protein